MASLVKLRTAVYDQRTEKLTILMAGSMKVNTNIRTSAMVIFPYRAYTRKMENTDREE